MSTPPCRRASVALLILLVSLIVGCDPRRERSERVALRLTTQEIGPGSGFELVFEEALLRLEDIGTSPLNPLRVEPPLAGTFTWRSRRSGVFQPTEPLRLGTRYRFSLQAGLKDAQGRPLAVALQRSWTTPSLVAAVERSAYWPDSEPPPMPSFHATFNATVAAADLARSVAFTDGRQRIAAFVEAVPEGRGSWFVPPTWRERFPGWTNLPGASRWPEGRSAGFTLRPQRPLESTNAWNLEVAQDLRSVEDGVRLEAPVRVPVGRVKPFEVRSIEPVHRLVGGRCLEVDFSQPVTPAITNLDLSTWVRCQPEVSDLRSTRSPDGRRITLSGAFEVGREYRIRILPGLAGEDPWALRQGTEAAVVVPPIRPNVWLPVFDTVQLATGARRLELMAVNTPRTRLRVKALDAHGLIPTLRAYQRYLRRDDVPDQAPGAPLDYAGIPGRTVLDHEVDTRGPRDEAVRVARTWDEWIPSDGREGPRVGAYFVSTDLHGLPAGAGAMEHRVGPQGLVQLTDLGFVTKVGAETTMVWVFSHHTGRSLPGATVSLRSEENGVLAKAVTDDAGLARLPNREAAWVLVERGGDLHAQPLHEGYVSTWGFRLPGGRMEPEVWQLHAFADREAYRPGDVVHLKVLARRWHAGGWRLPEPGPVAVEVTGPRGARVARMELALGDAGSAEWTWTVPEGGRGEYRVELSGGGGTTSLPLTVRDFQPAAFEVTVEARPSYAAGEPVELPVRARYLFGQPLAEARVLWDVHASDRLFRPAGWESFRFGPSGLEPDAVAAPEGLVRESQRQGTGRLVGAEPFRVSAALPFDPIHPQPQRVVVLAEVTDLNQQTISRQVEFVRHASDFYLGFRWLHGEETLLAMGEPLPFQVVAVGADGKPAANPGEVTARLQRVEWTSVAVLEAGQVVGHRDQPEYHEVASLAVRPQSVESMGSRWQVSGEGAIGGTFPAPTQPGDYEVDLQGKDREGRPVRTTLRFAVAGDGRLAWHQRNGAHVDLVPDRTSHAAGRTATLLVKAPFPGTAWVTVEREDVRRSFTTELRGQAPSVSVPLQADDGPNVFVGVTLVRGVESNPHESPMPEWRVGYEMLRVDRPQDRLDVSVGCAEPMRAPGEPVALRAVVRDFLGRPVVGAEVTLYAVDEGFLQLTGTEVPDPGATFAAPRALGVSTAISLPALQPEAPELQRFVNKGYLAGGGGGRLAARRDFNPCPYWNGRLRTDAGGEVTATFPAPDSLTRYRVVAVATHEAAAMGSGATSFEVKKELLIESALPRFAHVGDHLLARALVINTGTRPRVARASLQPGAQAVLAPGTPGTREVSVPAGGSAVVDFPVDLRSPGEEAWRWQVEADGLADRSEVTLPVLWAEPTVRSVQHLRAGVGRTDLLSGIDLAALERPESVLVRLSASPLAYLGEGVARLLEYPYGCVEQTASSLLPWIALRDFPELLPTDGRSATNAAGALRAAERRFWSMQTESGGLSYWPGGKEPNRWGSAYAAWVLALARNAGLEVSEARLGRLHEWLREQWRADAAPLGAAHLEDRCLTALALSEAGEPDVGLQEALLRDPDALTPESRAWLAVAHLRSGGDASVARALLRMPRAGRTPARAGQFGGEARAAAARLLAFTALEPDGPEATGAVEAVLRAGAGGHWSTTQGNAWSLWALRQATAGVDTNLVSGSLQVGAQARPIRLEPGRRIVTETFALESGGAGPAGLTARLDLPAGTGVRPYVEVSVSGRPPGWTRQVAAIDRGFRLRRSYARLDAQNRPAPATNLVVGDRVLVTLDLDAQEPADWVAIEDPLPSLLEAVAGSFVTEATSATSVLPDWTSDFRELRKDRMLFFRDELPDGRHQVRYLARVRAAGEVVAAPAKVEAMYQTDRQGRSEGFRLRATAAP